MERLAKPEKSGVMSRCNDKHGRKHDTAVQKQLFVQQRPAPLPQQKQKIDAEVYAEQRHEHRTHILQVRAVIRHAVVFDAEAARARRTEGRAQAVEQGHAARQQKQYAPGR